MTNITSTDLAAAPLSDLFWLYRSILAELRRRKVVRTENAPAGDYAEYLVAAAFGGTLAMNSEKSHDVLTPEDERLQVKARVVSVPPSAGQLQLSAIRSFRFEWLIVVLLSEVDYSVVKASKIPSAVAKEIGTYHAYTNSTTVYARNELLEHPDAVDVTRELQSVQSAHVGGASNSHT